MTIPTDYNSDKYVQQKRLWNPWVLLILTLIIPYFCYSTEIGDELTWFIVAPVWTLSYPGVFFYAIGTNALPLLLLFSAPVLLSAFALILVLKKGNWSIELLDKIKYLILFSPIIVFFFYSIELSLNYSSFFAFPLPTSFIIHYFWHRNIVSHYRDLRNVMVDKVDVLPKPYPTPTHRWDIKKVREERKAPRDERILRGRKILEDAKPILDSLIHPTSAVSEAGVQVLRGGDFVGNRFRFKVKVTNNSDFVITDITVTIISYPKDSLKLEDDITKAISKINPRGFTSPTFDFLPTQDCVKGDIIASVSYLNYEGKAYSITAEPLTVRAVCDLLRPETISSEEFILKLATLGHGELASRVEDWTPEEMLTKTMQILESSNFFKVTSESTPLGDHIQSKIEGWARGMYTGKSLGVQIIISGKPDVKGATCKVRMYGEDEAMIMPAIDEITQKLSAWLCPMCSGSLPPNAVENLKDDKSVQCPFCGVTLNR